MLKRTVLSRVEIEEETLYIRLLKQIVEGEKVLFSEPHRYAFPLDNSKVPDKAQLENLNLGLGDFGYPPVEKKDWDRIAAHLKVARGA